MFSSTVSACLPEALICTERTALECPKSSIGFCSTGSSKFNKNVFPSELAAIQRLPSASMSTAVISESSSNNKRDILVLVSHNLTSPLADPVSAVPQLRVADIAVIGLG